MTTYQRGAKGPEVKQIQQKLQELNLYQGLIDGDFGGGTESAVIRFQKANNLPADGKVDLATWQVLFPGQRTVPAPTVTAKPLLDRCLELTGAFETSLPPATRQLIEQDFRAHPPTGNLATDEPIRLVIIANRRADAAKARWREDVRKRKLTIAEGQGTVHGSHYDLEEHYALKLIPAEGL